MANVTPPVARRYFKEYIALLLLRKKKLEQGKLVYYLDTKLLVYKRFLLTYGHLLCVYKRESTMIKYQGIPVT